MNAYRTGKVRVSLALALILLTFTALLPATIPTAEASHGIVPVTVIITEVVANEDPDPGLAQGVADMYARVQIDGFDAQESAVIDDDASINPDWTFSRDVDTAVTGDTITISIQIFDEDSGIAAPDDVLDIDPADNETSLDLILDLTTGDWTGDVPLNQGFSSGDGDTGAPCCDGLLEGGERASIQFDIVSLIDTDRDGLLDDWEINGYDADGDGVIDVDLPAMGADPFHKDLFLEFDWMAGQEPRRRELAAIKQAFAAAPIDAGGNLNPDGLPGINLWIDTGSLTDASGALVGDNLGGGNEIPATRIPALDDDFYAVKTANFDAARKDIFRYGLSARPCEDCGGGWGELGGNDFIEYNHDGGTIMHELGHNLNLDHGGDDSQNCKPNYVSVMSYDQQFGIGQNDGGRIYDFSPPRTTTGRGLVPAGLDESNLSEATILDASDSSNQFVFTNGEGLKVRNPVNTPADWNGDGDRNDSGLTVNVDTFGVSGRPGACENDVTTDTLTSHDDWTAIALDFKPFGDSADSAINPVTEREMTLRELLDLEDELSSADLIVDIEADPIDAIAGLGVSYTATVTNDGPNRVNDVQLDVTLPDGLTHVGNDGGCTVGATINCSIDTLGDQESFTVTIDTAIDPALVYNAGAPITVTTTASASFDGTDFDEANNTAQVDVEVIAVADVAVTALTPPTTAQILIGQDEVIDIGTSVVNGGPSSPVDAVVSLGATASDGAAATPDVESMPVIALTDTPVEVTSTFTLACLAPSQPTFSFSSEIALAQAADTDPHLANNAMVADVPVDCVTPVRIDIKPTRINLSKPTATVRLLSTLAGEFGLPVDFDATLVDIDSVRFGTRDQVWNETGGASDRNGRLQGGSDAVLQFRTRDTGLTLADTEACVKGTWTDATGTFTFFGCAEVDVF